MYNKQPIMSKLGNLHLYLEMYSYRPYVLALLLRILEIQEVQTHLLLKMNPDFTGI